RLGEAAPAQLLERDEVDPARDELRPRRRQRLLQMGGGGLVGPDVDAPAGDRGEGHAGAAPFRRRLSPMCGRGTSPVKPYTSGGSFTVVPAGEKAYVAGAGGCV